MPHALFWGNEAYFAFGTFSTPVCVCFKSVLRCAGNLKNLLCVQKYNGCICIGKIWPIHCTLVRLGKKFFYLITVNSFAIMILHWGHLAWLMWLQFITGQFKFLLNRIAVSIPCLNLFFSVQNHSRLLNLNLSKEIRN